MRLRPFEFKAGAAASDAGVRRPDRGWSGGVSQRTLLADVVSGAWRSFERAAALESRVAPSVPVLFFGDVDAYFGSPLRVVTVGLNPSSKEFPASDPFERFPLAEGIGADDLDGYLDALSAYFHTSPYNKWFRHLEPLLAGMDAGYWPGQASTALHTDICSPVATDPTWSRLAPADRETLLADGVPLWHGLLEALRPEAVVFSVAECHLSGIGFDAIDEEWGDFHIIDTLAGGGPRKPPYRVQARRYMVGRSAARFVFCPAMRSPLPIGTDQKRELGAIIADRSADGR